MATTAATSAAVTLGKRGCGGRNLRRRVMQLQLRGPQKKLASTKSAPQRNSSFAHQLATSVRMASAPMGEQTNSIKLQQMHTCHRGARLAGVEESIHRCRLLRSVFLLRHETKYAKVVPALEGQQRLCVVTTRYTAARAAAPFLHCRPYSLAGPTIL